MIKATSVKIHKYDLSLANRSTRFTCFNISKSVIITHHTSQHLEKQSPPEKKKHKAGRVDRGHGNFSLLSSLFSFSFATGFSHIPICVKGGWGAKKVGGEEVEDRLAKLLPSYLEMNARWGEVIVGKL